MSTTNAAAIINVGESFVRKLRYNLRRYDLIEVEPKTDEYVNSGNSLCWTVTDHAQKLISHIFVSHEVDV